MFFGTDAKKDAKDAEKKMDDVAPPMPKKTDNSAPQQRTKFQKPLPKQTTDAPDAGQGTQPAPQTQAARDPEEPAPVPQQPDATSEASAGPKLNFMEKMRLKREQEALNKTQQSLNQSQDREEPAPHHRNESLNGSAWKVLEEPVETRDEPPAEKPKFGFLNKPKAPVSTQDQQADPQTASVPKKFVRPVKRQQSETVESQGEQPESLPQETAADAPAQSGLGKFFRPAPKTRTPEPEHAREAEEQEQAERHEIEQELDSHTPIAQKQQAQPSAKFSFLNRKKQPEADAGENLNDQTLNLSIIDRDHGENFEETLHKDDSSHHSQKSVQAYRIETRSFVIVSHIGYGAVGAAVRPNTWRNKARDVPAHPRPEREEEAAEPARRLPARNRPQLAGAAARAGRGHPRREVHRGGAAGGAAEGARGQGWLG